MRKKLVERRYQGYTLLATHEQSGLLGGFVLWRCTFCRCAFAIFEPSNDPEKEVPSNCPHCGARFTSWLRKGQ